MEGNKIVPLCNFRKLKYPITLEDEDLIMRSIHFRIVFQD